MPVTAKRFAGRIYQTKNHGRFLRANWKVMWRINFRSAGETRPRSWRSRIEELPGFAGTAPLITFGGSTLREPRNLRRCFPVVEELVHGNFEGARQLLERLDAWDGVAVLHTGNVATLQASTLLSVSLREIFLLADGAPAVGDYYGYWLYHMIGE